MQRAGELVSGFQPSSGYEGRTPQPLKTAAKLWLRMAEIYGHKWSSQMGDTPTELWSMALSGLSGDEIREGLKSCITNGNAWPPSLPEFLAMCRPPKREFGAAYRIVPMLPTPVSTRETAVGWLKKARAAIR